MKPYYFNYGEDTMFSMIPQEGVKLAQPVGYNGYNCCWDAALSPDGVFYFSLGSESGEGGYAYLNRYNEADNTIEKCFYTKDVVLPSSRALPGSKIHTAISFLEDGRIICCNHTTDKAPNHQEWLPYAYYSHPWESFQGSTLMIYDPKTGHVDNLGIPVPHESIYGGVYVSAKKAYYMIGYQCGHIYKYDLNDHTVKDLGKAIETCSHRIHLGPDGNVYFTSPIGFFMKVNTEVDEIEWTGIRLPEHDSDPDKQFVYRYISTYINLDDHRMLMVAGYSNHLMEYDTATGKLTEYGPMDNSKEFFIGFGNYYYCFNSALDKDGVLWYAMTPRMIFPPKEWENHKLPMCSYLYCWNYKNPDAEPIMIGQMGTPNCGMSIISEICIDKDRDKLFASCAHDVEYGPGIISIDLKVLRNHIGEAGPTLKDNRFYPAVLSEPIPQTAEYEGVGLINVHEAFPANNTNLIRIWTELKDDMRSAKVLGLYWEDNNTICGVCGDKEPKYAFRATKNGDLFIDLLDDVTRERKEEILARSIKSVNDIDVKLPHVAGRQYLAVATATAKWNNDREMVGTKDGKLAIVNGQDVYSLGLTTCAGPVRAICVSSDLTKAYITAGDDLDIGKVFSYDDHNGLQELGMFRALRKGKEHGFGADILTAIAISPDNKALVVGTGDLIASLFIVNIEQHKDI